MTLKNKITSDYLSSELEFYASRSSGSGGQHVNKVNTKVGLKWDVTNSDLLSHKDRELVLKKLSNKITKEGVLMLSAQSKRSQLLNKAEVLQKLDKLLVRVFAKTKSRKPTKPSYSSVKKRLESKKRQSEKKKWRKGL